MKNNNTLRMISTVLGLGLFAQIVVAQTITGVGKQRHISFAAETLGEFAPMTDDASEALDSQCHCNSGILRNTPTATLLKQAQAKGIMPEINEMTLYLGNNAFRVDMQAPTGKMSYLMLLDKGMTYTIMWDQKKYMEMSLEKMKGMRAGVKKQMDAYRNNPELQKMLEKLPPEARQHMPGAALGQTENAQKKTAKKTGQTKTLNGFACVEYLVTDDDEQSYVWVTTSNPRLVKAYREFGEKFSQAVGSDAEDTDEIYSLIPDGLPVLQNRFEQGRWGLPGFAVEEFLGFEEKALPANTFQVPVDFTKGSMMDMMNMQQKRPGKQD